MEFNKRKSLLTPAAPTVWGMIHGDIDNQKDILEKIDAAVKSELEDFEVDVDLSDYYTKSEIDAALENIDVDLTGYATEDWVKEQGYLTEHQSLTGYATESWVNGNLQKKADTDYVDAVIGETIDYVNSQLGELDTITQDILA